MSGNQDSIVVHIRGGHQIVTFDGTVSPKTPNEVYRWSVEVLEREQASLEALGEIKKRSIEVLSESDDAVDLRLTVEIRPHFLIDREAVT